MQEEIQKCIDAIHAKIIANQPKSNSLFGGSLGLALYHFSFYKAKGNEENAEKAVAHIASVLQNLEEEGFGNLGFSFCTGIAGLAYMLRLFEQEGLIEMEEEDQISIDNFLFKSAKELLQNSNRHDYLHGVMGILFYFLQKLPNPVIAVYAQEITQLFCDKAVYNNNGTWFRNYVVPEDKEEDINFSLSHGQAGFLIILAEAYGKGIRINIIPLLLENGIKLLLHHKREIQPGNKEFSMFPNSVHKKEIFFSNRLAWCYGDLNIALALYKIGEVLGKEEYTTLANTITDATLIRKKVSDTAIADSHICHGSAGLAQFYYSIFKITNNKLHKDAWYYWIQQTVEEYLPKELEKDYYENKECDLLEGLVGINLSLLNYLYPEDTRWSKILLL